jgi:hypothetical protein
MNYIIIEAQTDNGTTAIVTPAVYADAIEAEAVFLEKCAYARRSGLACHTVVLMDEEGKQLAKKTFKE